MASKTALPIARLRALGCKVGTVFYDHEPHLGLWHYSITLPKGVGSGIAEGMSTHGSATLRKAPADDRLILQGGTRGSLTPLHEAETDVAYLLSALADILTGRTLS